MRKSPFRIATSIVIVSLMDAALLWTALGSAAAVPALAVGAWQLRLQILERSERRHRLDGESPLVAAGRGELPVTAPLGRLPADVRGRDVLLAELRRQLTRRGTRSGVWVLAGMGGLGKSTVALAVAATARLRGWRIWWVTASDPASLTGGMLEVLGQLGAPDLVTRAVREGAPTGPDRAWEILNTYHSAKDRWLLVFDNADNPAVLAAAGESTPADGTGWLRSGSAGMVIVTTRNRDPRVWGRDVKIRELRLLDDSTAAQVLRDLTPHIRDHDGQLAEELGHRLGGLPLALHLAGTYLASPFARWHSFADYLNALDSEGLADTLVALDEPSEQARATVSRTWELSLDALAAEGRPQVRPLLFLLSCYAAATPIPLAMLRPELLSTILSASGQEGRIRDAGLHGLVSVGLIDTAVDSEGPTGQAVTVHPVVVDVNRNRLLTMAQSDLSPIGKTAVDLLQSFCTNLHTTTLADWPTWRRVVPHMAALLAWLAVHLDTQALADLVDTSVLGAHALWQSGNAPAAEKLAAAAVAASDRLGRDHPTTLTARSELALIVAESRYGEAEKMFRDLLIDQQRVLGPAHPDTFVSQRVLARLAGLQGRHREAESLYRQLIADRTQILGKDHPETLHARHGLGWTIARQGREEDAESLFRQLLSDRLRVFGNNDPACLETRRSIAAMVSRQHRHQEAEQLYRELIPDQQRVQGTDHPRTLAARHGLASTISAQGRLDEAAQMYREILADRMKILGDAHPDTLATRAALAEITDGPGLPPPE